MTANTRIAVNIIATYGRSLLAMACGIITGRWLLSSLGVVDYGLFGVIGGLSIFIVFLNNEVSGAVSRYFSVSVGNIRHSDQDSPELEDSRKWFNSALCIHTALAFVLVGVGYPIGVWAIKCFLNIPTDRIYACVWVWRFSCVSSYVGMASVPFVAMYTAKQNIAERTVYEISATIVNFLFMCYMVHTPQDWLAKYAGWSCFVCSVPKVIMCISAAKRFKECRFNPRYLFIWPRIKELVCFSCFRLWGAVAWLLQSQGTTIIINKILGAERNAAMTVGNTVASQTTTFASSMSAALWPAAMNAYGAGDMERAKELAYQVSKIGVVAILFFAIPVSLEVDALLTLWLKAPPQGAGTLSIFIILAVLIDQITSGFNLMINARGVIASYQKVVGIECLLTLIVCFVLVKSGLGIIGVGISYVFLKAIDSFARLYFGRKLGGLLILPWIKHILVPILTVVAIVLVVGALPTFLMTESFLRVCIVTLVSEVTFIPLIWLIIFSQRDRDYILSRIHLKKNVL